MLKNKKVLIFVSGSIAVYKTLELIRLLRKEGAFVRVVATQNALRFITPLSFEALSNTPLLHDGNESWNTYFHTCDSKQYHHNTDNSHLFKSMRDSKERLPYPTTQDNTTFTSPTQSSNDYLQYHQENDFAPLNHIGYAKWADIAVFAPISVNSINKLACGIADNVYLSCTIALPHKKLYGMQEKTTKNYRTQIPKLLAPSANPLMLDNMATNHNIELLKTRGFEIIAPDLGLLACGDVGSGAMANPQEILFRIKRSLSVCQYWHGKNVLITGGGSSENIDTIRCISNHSSGLQACNLALALYFLGAKVCLITSKIPITLPRDIEIIRVTSSQDYLQALQTKIKEIEDSESKSHNLSTQQKPCAIPKESTLIDNICTSTHKHINKNFSFYNSYSQDINNHNIIQKTYLFMAAAISDYIPTTKKGKLKKQDIGNEMQLTLYENIDILKSLQGNNLVKIAFKAECDAENAIKNAIKILDSKNCAMVCLNIISENNMSFGNNTNQMYFLTKDTRCKIQDNKFNISLKLCQHIESLGL